VSTMIEFRTLGGLDLRASDGRQLEPLLAQPKPLALLAYLAVATPHGFHRRDTLVGLLWPELDARHARTGLRKGLHLLRRSLGNGTVATRGDEEVAVDPDTFWCDAVAFRAARDTERWREALDLYRGDLLPGFFVSEAPEFERWLEEERARLRSSAAVVVWSAAQGAERDGDSALAAHLARRAAELTPDDEPALARLITLLDGQGNRAGAIRAYQEFAERLARDLDVEPSAETKSLIAAVRARETTRGATPAAGAGLSESVDSAEGVAPAPPAAAGEGPRVASTRVRWAVLAAAAGVAIAGAVVGSRGRGEAALNPRRVVVAPFANRTNDSTLNPLGELAADWIARELVQTGVVDVAAPPSLLLGPSELHGPESRTGASGGPVTAHALAVATGAGTVVSGSFYARGDSVEFATQISDERTGKVLQSLDPVAGERQDPRHAITMVRSRVIASLATLLDPRLGQWAGHASQPPSYEAYVAFAAGVEVLFEQLQHRQALPYFYRAAALDSTYTLPLVWAAWSHQGLGECDQTDSIGRVLGAATRRLPRVDRYLMDLHLARCRGDLPAAYGSSLALAEAVPGSEMMATFPAYLALALGRPRETLQRLERLHPERGELRGHTPYHLWVTAALHLLGEHERELEAARRARRLNPNNLAALRFELIALAGLGRDPDVRARIAEVAAVPPHPLRKPSTVMREAALELRAHGYPDAGRQVLEHTVAWLRSRPAEEQATEFWRSEQALTLAAAEQWDAARDVAERLVREHPNNVHYVGLLGVLAAQRGDRSEASHLDSALAGMKPRPYVHLAAYWRACIAARLGARDRAVALLEAARAQGLPYHEVSLGMYPNGVESLHTEVSFEPLRDYPPFRELLRPKG